MFGMPEVDLMASRANRQMDTYVSWHPQPGAKSVDAFSISWKEGLLYVFPPFSIIGQTISKIIQDDSDVILVVPDWNTQYWYALAVNMADQILKIKPHPKKPEADTRSIKTTPTASEVRTTNYKDTTNYIITASLRKSTRKTYGNYIKQWHDFIGNRSGVDINLILDVLSTLFEKGSAYSVINSAKCAIATVVTIPQFSSIIDHPLMKRYMTGVHNLRPPKPKLDFIWDVSIVFRHIKCPDNTVLSDKLLTHKLLILLLLLGGQRMNTIKSFHIYRMFLTDISVTFCPANVLKHSRKSKENGCFFISCLY